MEMHADDDFSVAFEYASGATARRFQNPLWYITELVFGSQLRRSLESVRSFGRSIVASAQKDSKRERDTVDSSANPADAISGSLIQSLLESIGDEKTVADAALNYLSAGRDTTAQALTWAFYLLMRHRYVTGQVRKEVREALVNADMDTVPDRIDSTLFTPVSMPYTMAVFYETLRLYPPVPFEFKQAEQATTLPDGTLLPKSSVVLWCPWAMNRSKITWGDDADTFRPERWLLDGKVVNRSPSEFPVFNGGPRTCLGKKMAEAIAVQVIATVTWTFDFMHQYDGDRVSKTSLTLPMDGGLPCVLKKRSFAPGSLL